MTTTMQAGSAFYGWYSTQRKDRTVKIDDPDQLSMDVAVYAGGTLLAGGGMTYQVDCRQGAYTSIRAMSRLSAAGIYDIRLESQGPAGPIDWLTFRASLIDSWGSPLGVVGLPMLVYTHPHPVPMVAHFPPIAPGVPVHTLALRVVGKLSLDPREDQPSAGDLALGVIADLDGQPRGH